MIASNTYVLWVLSGIALLLGLVSMSSVVVLRKRFKSAFASLSSKKNLADTITEYFEKVNTSHQKIEELQKNYEHLASIGARSIQKTGIVRFNPFRDTGGDQSFCMALLDNHDSGFLMTSIHGREGTRVYVKPVAYGASKYTLSSEEQQALKAARLPAKEKGATKEQ